MKFLKKAVKILEKNISRDILMFAKILDAIPSLPQPEQLFGEANLLSSSDFSPLTCRAQGQS